MNPALSLPLQGLLAVLLLAFCPRSEACFDRNKALDPENTWTWLQTLSMDNRLYYKPATDSPDTMEVESEPNMPKYFKRHYTCLQEFEGHSMLVEVVQSGKSRFQCLRFETLTKYVVRVYKTKLRALKKKVDCEKEKYEADSALLMAHDWLQPQPCPLHGGYQMLLHQGENIQGHCLDSVYHYNPNIRFQCDGHNVVADFGRDCEPPALLENQLLRQRHVTHLSCVGSWTEKQNIKSVLLRMRDQPYTFWCIHYREINNGSTELLSVFMTLDGRCVPDAFHNEDVPKKTSLFGRLASYVPVDDPRCAETEYLDHCRTMRLSCSDSNDCPASCQRCNRKPHKSGCSFMSNTIGTWHTVDSGKQMKVDVSTARIRVKGYGEFSCRGEQEGDHVYPVVQADEMSTCVPFYACAQVYSPVPGMLQFFLRPVWRDEDSGDPFTCKQTQDKIGYVIPAVDEKVLSMINSKQLQKSSCGFIDSQKFPTIIENCLMKVEVCGEDCDHMDISFDNETCDEITMQGFNLLPSLECYGSFELTDSIRGLLTYSEFSDSYFCWILTHSRLFVTTPQDCNSEKARSILGDREAAVTYDPTSLLSRPFVAGSSGGDAKDNNNGPNGGNSFSMHQNAGVVILTSLLLWLWCIFM